MKIGKVPQAVLKRSVLKVMQIEKQETVFPLSAAEMCAAVHLHSAAAAVFTTASVFGSNAGVGRYAVIRAVNDLATRRAKPLGISIQIALPPHTQESDLKLLSKQMGEVCSMMQIAVLCFSAEVSIAVNQTVVTVTAVGVGKTESLIQSSMAMPGQDIVLLGWVGLEGMLRIVAEEGEVLSGRFVPSFMKQIQELDKELLTLPFIERAGDYGVSAMHQIGSGGIFAALWELTEASGIGLEVSLSRLSIRQETVEICEYFQVNPYQMTATGTVLLTTADGDGLVRILEAAGAQAVKIGVTTKESTRIIKKGQEERFLDRPQQDELMCWWEKKMTKSKEEKRC